MAENEVKIDPELLKSLGKVYSHLPEERIPYDPNNPKGPGHILKSNDPPRQFTYTQTLIVNK